MAGGPTNHKEEMDISMNDDLDSGSLGPTQEQLLMAEMMERGIRSLGFTQRRQKMDPKTPGQMGWTPASTRTKKAGPPPRMSRDAAPGDTPPMDFSGTFQGLKFHHERNAELDMLAEIGLEELNGLEMEVMRRQMSIITERLRALEDQGATWRSRETVFFTLVVSACIVNLWLWMRQ